ncbi:hypothetical protein LAZ67_15000145 [Cordylochernes scorpioides]|uniref:Uncharacterized protein n=1 Tax=Cordylochernes scorpioides TaxID=51811 RepID=A0ABY6L856_9ARAC|nr:hypothetical protein LAZ67_15000145 [Cordylochernes scorpioides]
MEQRAVVTFNAKLGKSASETFILMKQVYESSSSDKSIHQEWVCPRYGYRPPLYINLVRDPVERLISTFSYRRQTAHLHQTKQPSDYWLNKKYENCVRKKDPECLFLDGTAYDRLQITFFCGQFEECKSYAVVGVVEEWNMTLAVLEDILPQFFRGAARIYHEEMPGSRLNPSEPKFKQEVSQQVKDLVKANLSHEYELYNFALQRLHQQYRSIRNF